MKTHITRILIARNAIITSMIVHTIEQGQDMIRYYKGYTHTCGVVWRLFRFPKWSKVLLWF